MFNIGFPELAIILVLLVVLAFEIAMFIDVIKSKTLSMTAKVVWALAMVLIHPLAAICYYFWQYRKVAS